MESRRPTDSNCERKGLCQFLRDVVLFVIANDDGLDEEAKARVASLRIRESANGECAAQVGLYILKNLKKIRAEEDQFEDGTRDFVQCLRIVSFTKEEFFENFGLLEEYINDICRSVLKPGLPVPGMYLYFLMIISELCCKIAEEDEQESYIGYVLQRTGHYMYLYREAFPGYEALFDFAKQKL